MPDVLKGFLGRKHYICLKPEVQKGMIWIYDSPLGRILIETSEKGIKTLTFIEEDGIIYDQRRDQELGMKSKMSSHLRTGTIQDSMYYNSLDYEVKDEMSSHLNLQLDEYFGGRCGEFNLPLDLQGTEFQKRVWAELQKIPFGKTVTYKELALRLGDVKAIRAVGTANGANPVSLIVPCHRVIGSDGSLVGYGGGLWRKKWLLQHEGALKPELGF